MVPKINESLLEPVAVFYVADPSGADKGDLLGAGLTGADRLAVPEHWLGQRAPPVSAHTALALLYIALTAAALVGNGLVIFIFITSKSLRTASNMLVLNLAVCDFLMMAKAPLFIYNSVKRGFASGVAGCNAFAFVGAYSGIVAGATNACIAYDRHSAITRPLDGRLSRGKATLMLTLVWLYATPWAVLPLLQIWGRFVPEGYLTSCSFDYLTRTFDTRLFVACITFCSYVMPMSLVLFFYSGIVKRVFAHEAALRAQAKKMQVDSLRANQQASAQTAEIRIAKAALTVCFMFVASWTPYGVMALIGAFGDQALLTPGVTMIPAVACKVVACVDPWIYAISHPKYRQELQRRLPWLQIDEPADETASTCTAATNAPAPAT